MRRPPTTPTSSTFRYPRRVCPNGPAAGAWTGEVPAETVESMLVQQAVQEVREATGQDEEAIAAGYLEKLDPFHGTQ